MITGVDQHNRMSPTGRRVRRNDVDGWVGTIADGPHCSYGVTVEWDNGTRTYISTMRVDDADES